MPLLFPLVILYTAGRSTAGVSSRKKISLNRHPAALLKIRRADERVRSSSGRSKRENNSDSNDTDTKGHEKNQGKGGENEGGGRTEVLFLDDLREIEQALFEAGKEEEDQASAESVAYTDTTPRQPSPPQEDQHHRSVPHPSLSGDDISRRQNLPTESGGSPKAKTRAAGLTSETNTSGAEEDQQTVSFLHGQVVAAPRADIAVSNTQPLMSNTLARGGELPVEDGASKATASLVRRPRPWAIQKFLRSKGPRAWCVLHKLKRLSDLNLGGSHNISGSSFFSK